MFSDTISDTIDKKICVITGEHVEGVILFSKQQLQRWHKVVKADLVCTPYKVMQIIAH